MTIMLPDGTSFADWRLDWQPRRTLWVDGTQGDDDHCGSQERPLRSIGRAAKLVEPGFQVRVRSGVYRESIDLAVGGQGPETPISFEGEGVGTVIKGSRLVEGGWCRTWAGEGLWRLSLDPGWFGPQGNPFSLVNLPRAHFAHMPWAEGLEDAAPARRRRGLLFQDGRRLLQTRSLAEAAADHGRYWVDDDGWTVFLRPFKNADPNTVTIEITDRCGLVAPMRPGLGHIRLAGFTFAQVGNGFPRPQRGAVSARAGHHWVIEGNRIEQINGIGLDIGSGWEIDGSPRQVGSHHIVCGNEFVDCGIGGIEGERVEQTLVEENVIRGTGWHDFLKLWECAGIKLHWARSCVVRANRIVGTIGAPGIWLDFGNANTRCSGNLCTGIGENIHGGIFIEASRETNLVDGNAVWGSAAHGIKLADSDHQRVEGNVVACCAQAGFRTNHNPQREVLGRPATSEGNRFIGNGVFDCGVSFDLDGTPVEEGNHEVDQAEVMRRFGLG